MGVLSKILYEVKTKRVGCGEISVTGKLGQIIVDPKRVDINITVRFLWGSKIMYAIPEKKADKLNPVIDILKIRARFAFWVAILDKVVRLVTTNRAYDNWVSVHLWKYVYRKHTICTYSLDRIRDEEVRLENSLPVS